MYNFREQLDQGQISERLMDRFFSDKYLIRPATDIQQRQGIDRFFQLKAEPDSDWRSVEYKADARAARTGNTFIEIISVLREDKLVRSGWASTCKAEWIMYYVPGLDCIYHAETQRVRSHLNEWSKTYKYKCVRNSGYKTCGLLVPLRVFKQLCCIDQYEIKL